MTVIEVRQAILDRLAEVGERGVTAYELSRRPVELDRRAAMLALQVLELQGSIKPSGYRRVAGRPSAAWRVYVLDDAGTWRLNA